MTLAGTLSFFWSKSTIRYLLFAPPPLWRTVILPEFPLPALLFKVKSNLFSGSFLVNILLADISFFFILSRHYFYFLALLYFNNCFFISLFPSFSCPAYSSFLFMNINNSYFFHLCPIERFNCFFNFNLIASGQNFKNILINLAKICCLFCDMRRS